MCIDETWLSLPFPSGLFGFDISRLGTASFECIIHHGKSCTQRLCCSLVRQLRKCSQLVCCWSWSLYPFWSIHANWFVNGQHSFFIVFPHGLIAFDHDVNGKSLFWWDSTLIILNFTQNTIVKLACSQENHDKFQIQKTSKLHKSFQQTLPHFP